MASPHHGPDRQDPAAPALAVHPDPGPPGWRHPLAMARLYADRRARAAVRDGFREPERLHGRRAQARLRLALMIEAKIYQLMVEQVKDYAFFLLGPDGRILTWNLGAQAIKGYAPEEIIGRHFSVFYTREAVDL